MECPRCKGRGAEFVTGFFEYADKSKSGWEENKLMPCSQCNGTGGISEAQARQMRIGKYVAERRDEMDLGMREAAKRLKMTVVDYCDLEHGRFGFRN